MQSAPMGKKRKKAGSKKTPRKKRNRRYSAEFRQKAVRLVMESDKPIALLARELGVVQATLYHWVRQHERDHGAPAPVGESEAETIARLEKRVTQLEEEREILKKAATFFAQESK